MSFAGMSNGVPADKRALRNKGYSRVEYPDDDASRATFYLQDDPYKLASQHALMEAEKNGTDIDPELYPAREMIKVVTPLGNGLKPIEVHHDAKPYWKQRFAEEYALFKHGKPQDSNETALSEWDEMPREEAESLRVNMGLYTVQQYAKLDQSIVLSLPHGRDRHKAAQAFVRKEVGSEVMAAVNTANERLAEENVDLKTRLEKLEALVLDSKGKPTSSKGSKS